MPTAFGDIVTAVGSFVADYQVFLTAGVVLGLAFWGIRKLIKMGR